MMRHKLTLIRDNKWWIIRSRKLYYIIIFILLGFLIVLSKLIKLYRGTTLNSYQELSDDWYLVFDPTATVAIVMIAAPSVKNAPFRKRAIADKISYCRRHGYDLIVADRILDKARHPSWSKLILMQMVAKSDRYRQLVWMDLDVLIWRPELKLQNVFKSTEKPKASIILAYDLGPEIEDRVNFGIFSLYYNYNTHPAPNRHFLEQIYTYGWRFEFFQGIFYFNMEQDAARWILKNHESVGVYKSEIAILPRKQVWSLFEEATVLEINEYDSFLIHFLNCVDSVCINKFNIIWNALQKRA